MKKKVLFVIPSLRSGGAEKSLITLLSLFDYDRYEVDLLSFRKDGLFMAKIPEEVTLIGNTEDYEVFDGDAKSAFLYFIKKGKPATAYARYKYMKACRLKDSYLREKGVWEILKKLLPKTEKKYDCAIGYLEGTAGFYAVQCVNAKRKICYIHSDIKKLGLDERMSEETFQKADAVVTVSKQCMESFTDSFPQFKDRTYVIENITSPSILGKESSIMEAYDKKDGKINILTVGRFSEPKGIDLAVKACSLLKDRGKNIRWYHIGTGELKSEIEALIDKLDLEETFILLGERSNPYPYMGQCDIYVQPSRYEGKSIAIDEAKCLGRPIVVTDFSTVADQITDGKDGLICEMNEKDIADKIEMLIDNPQMREKLSANLAEEKTGNEEETEKLYSLIG